MAEHPSLKDKFIGPEPLIPREHMGAYEPCWCGSGKKWKWCHKTREELRPIHFGKLISEMREEMQRGYCSHPLASESECSEKIIRAHTVQRRKGIAGIAEEGHVMSVKAGIEDLLENEGRIEPKLVGVRSASTFNGFCGKHDSDMFRPVEVGVPTLTQETIFLLTFRAMAYELYTKRAQVRSNPIQRMLDCGKPFIVQASVQSHLHIVHQGAVRGLSNIEEWKALYDLAYRSSDYSQFKFYAVQFDELLPVVACGAFHPEYDFSGRRLQIISRGSHRFDHIAFNLTSMDNVSVAVFGWVSSNNGPSEDFIESYRRVPNEEKANAAIHLAFEHLENTYLRPSWWNSLSAKHREFALLKFRSGLGSSEHDRGPSSLVARPCVYSGASVVAKV